MNIIMSYIDHRRADISERELFTFTSPEVCQLYNRIKEFEDILGGVLIATCNRTELYLSMRDGKFYDPFDLICDIKNQDAAAMSRVKKTISGHDAIRHLMLVASGTESQIWGDAQIISQVRDAARVAKEQKTTDSILNVLFRNAISAGKKVKTNIDFNISDNSTALKAVSILKEHDNINKVLIIGNGVIGRLVGESLVANKFESTMTLRQFKSGAISVPRKIDTVNYAERYSVISEYDAVISATLSPHYTLHYEDMKNIERWPKVFIDLAMPRDIDPRIVESDTAENPRELPEYYDLDMISKDEVIESKEDHMFEVNEIINEFEQEFYRWYDYKMTMGGIK